MGTEKRFFKIFRGLTVLTLISAGMILLPSKVHAADSWSTGAAGGTARFMFASATYNGKLYNWGGLNASNSNLNTMDIYDIATNTWSTGTAGGTARSYFDGAEYGGKIYFWAGDNAAHQVINSLDIYDIATDSWSTGTSGGTIRYAQRSLFYDGKMYNWGGKNASSVALNTLDIYDTGYHPNPEFANLPGESVPINITDGQVITTPTYTIEVKPTSPNDIEKVEFYIDNVLIDTDYTADSNGVYSTIWDTTIYHSDIRVVAYDPFGRTTELTRTATVNGGLNNNNNNTSTTITELPATGADITNFRFLAFIPLKVLKNAGQE